jgi:nicotinamidase-related amidase
MAESNDLSRTAVLLVDPYNDFLSEGGKLWPLVKPVATEVDLLDNLRTAITTARDAGVPVLFVPHRRWEESNYVGWDHPNPNQQGVNQQQTFARGSWGGEFHPDFQPPPEDVDHHRTLGTERVCQH